MVLNWGIYEQFIPVDPDEPLKDPEFLQRSSRSSALKNIKLEAGYVYTFTININSKGSGDPDDPDVEKDIYVELTEKIPWDYIVETKDYDEIQAGYPELEFKNMALDDTANRNVYVHQKGSDTPLECWVRLASPKGAKLLIKIEQEFDAFEYEFLTSDQIPEDSGNSSETTPIKFKLIPVYDNPEREYVATLSLSLRLVNGRIVNIDNQVQSLGKYRIILQKAL